MELEKLKQLIETAIPTATVEVKGDGYHFEVLVVSDQFQNQSTLVRQKSVYAAVSTQIQSGELHALSITAKTPEEWQS
jgi:acid stress-induced BolA-like protein IbaG/YrbA